MSDVKSSVATLTRLIEDNELKYRHERSELELTILQQESKLKEYENQMMNMLNMVEALKENLRKETKIINDENQTLTVQNEVAEELLSNYEAIFGKDQELIRQYQSIETELRASLFLHENNKIEFEKTLKNLTNIIATKDLQNENLKIQNENLNTKLTEVNKQLAPRWKGYAQAKNESFNYLQQLILNDSNSKIACACKQRDFFNIFEGTSNKSFIQTVTLLLDIEMVISRLIFLVSYVHETYSTEILLDHQSNPTSVKKEKGFIKWMNLFGDVVGKNLTLLYGVYNRDSICLVENRMKDVSVLSSSMDMMKTHIQKMYTTAVTSGLSPVIEIEPLNQAANILQDNLAKANSNSPSPTKTNRNTPVVRLLAKLQKLGFNICSFLCGSTQSNLNTEESETWIMIFENALKVFASLSKKWITPEGILTEMPSNLSSLWKPFSDECERFCRRVSGENGGTREKISLTKLKSFLESVKQFEPEVDGPNVFWKSVAENWRNEIVRKSTDTKNEADTLKLNMQELEDKTFELEDVNRQTNAENENLKAEIVELRVLAERSEAKISDFRETKDNQERLIENFHKQKAKIKKIQAKNDESQSRIQELKDNLDITTKTLNQKSQRKTGGTLETADLFKYKEVINRYEKELYRLQMYHMPKINSQALQKLCWSNPVSVPHSEFEENVLQKRNTRKLLYTDATEFKEAIDIMDEYRQLHISSWLHIFNVPYWDPTDLGRNEKEAIKMYGSQHQALRLKFQILRQKIETYFRRRLDTRRNYKGFGEYPSIATGRYLRDFAEAKSLAFPKGKAQPFPFLSMSLSGTGSRRKVLVTEEQADILMQKLFYAS